MISIQISSLVRSLILIPLSLLLIIACHIEALYSRVIIFIFVIIFIGGLMVLLVRIASLVYQEPGVAPSLVISRFIGVLLFSYKEITIDWQETTTLFLSWFETLKLMLFGFSLFVLIISLFVMTVLLLEFKGIIRGFFESID